MNFLRPSHFAGAALLFAVLSLGSASAELEMAQSGDIVVATTSVNETGTTALLVYSVSGRLKARIDTPRINLSKQSSMALSGDGKLAFLSTTDSAYDGRLSVIRIAGGEPKYLGMASITGIPSAGLLLGPNNLLAAGPPGPGGKVPVYLSYLSTVGCDTAVATASTYIVSLLYNPDGHTLTRTKLTLARKSLGCTTYPDSAVAAVQQLDSSLFVVLFNSTDKVISLHRSGVINGTPQDDAVATYTAIGLRGVCTEFLVTSATSFTGLCSSAAQSVTLVRADHGDQNVAHITHGVAAPELPDDAGNRTFLGGLGLSIGGETLYAATAVAGETGKFLGTAYRVVAFRASTLEALDTKVVLPAEDAAVAVTVVL